MKSNSLERRRVVRARRERERHSRREAILGAAERVIVRRGIAAASIEEMAAEAGLATGTVYLYFANKEALLHELLAAKIAALNAEVERVIDDGGEFGEQLPRVVEAMLVHFERERGFFAVFVQERLELTREAGGRSRDLIGMTDAGTAAMTRWLARAQGAGILGRRPARMMAIALRGIVFQVTRDWLRHGAGGRLLRHRPFIVDFFLGGARA